MSKCSHCLQGLCRRHPLQDHGEREALLKKKADEASRSALNALLQAQISKLEQEKGKFDDEELADHRLRLDADRQRMEKSQRKSAKRRNEYLSTTGLNPSVANMMLEHSDESDAESRARKHRRRDEKKSKKKRSKKEKKDKKDKKEKKSKRERSSKDSKHKSKKRHRHSSDSESDYSSDSSSSSSSSTSSSDDSR